MIKSNSLREIMLSDNNIYKAILSVDSYLFNKQLLCDLDIELVNSLNDKFNYNLLYRKEGKKQLDILDYNVKVRDIIDNGGLIQCIRNIIIKITDEGSEELFSVKVFFKLKDADSFKFRPLHSANLLDSIAMVAMLQMLIFYLNDDCINLSNLSKLIPSNFYGNIPSERPERLFEKWQLKYKEYSEVTNEKYSKFEKTGEYKYEVVLDLVNFFPSVNPVIIFDFIIESLQVKYSNSDLEIIKMITFKLLFFEVINFKDLNNEILCDLYYQEKINDECSKSITKGISQGLPQSYFFGNLMMVTISSIYDEVFKGQSYFYVDDSAIYTNMDLNENKFKECIEDLNNKLFEISDKKMKSSREYIDLFLDKLGFHNCINKTNQVIQVHKNGKSHYQYIRNSKVGYKYLSHLSRLASMGSFDIASTFEDYEEIQIKEKFEVIVEAIDKELELCEIIIEENRELNQRNGDKQHYCEKCIDNCFVYNSYKDYESKLKRFKRFFEYRILMINLQQSKENYNQIIDSIIMELTEDVFQTSIDDDLLEIKLSIITDFLLSSYSLDNEDCNKIKDISSKITEIENKIVRIKYGKETITKNCFYYTKVFGNDKKNKFEKVDKYSSINKIISTRISNVNKHIDYQSDELKILFEKLQNEGIVKYSFKALNKNLSAVFSYWANHSQYLQRIIYNAIISSILNIELNDSLFITRKSKKLINYYELRLAIAVRNSTVDDILVKKILSEYLKEINEKRINFRIIDYSIYEAIYYFKVFVKEPNYIDSLILVHKYTTELWENGSKHMHFYTLHNQSHAIELIKSINAILKAIDYLKISKLDFFILFISCYLHDISMVLYPTYDKFYDETWDEVNLLVNEVYQEITKNEYIEINSINQIKKSILKIYTRVDEIFEKEVRNNHAKNSAQFIRNSNELPFLSKSLLDNIADVSHSHGFDARDVFHLKSDAKNRNISLKFMMILIRLADLLDMNENRVSLPIFYNNKKNMSEITRFHWISHLLTGDYRFINTYEINDNKKMSYLRTGAIDENVMLEISIKFDQLTTVGDKILKKCSRIRMGNYQGDNSIILRIGSDDLVCNQKQCNFVCRWFNKKNEWLINELSYLQMYLGDIKGYFNTNFSIKLKLHDSKILKSEDFDKLKEYINKYDKI